MELLTLGLGLGVGALACHRVQALREHRSAPASLADDLQWSALVAPGTVQLKDGSLLAAWRLTGVDVTASTPGELTALVAHVSTALVALAGEWTLHVTAIRRPAAAVHADVFPSPILTLLDAERATRAARDVGRLYVTETILAATRRAPSEVASAIEGVLVSGGAPAREGPRRRGIDWDTVLRGFDAACAALEDRFLALRVERLDDDALCTHLHETLTGLAHPVAAPAHGVALNAVLSSQDFPGGIAPQIGDAHVRVVAVTGLPRRGVQPAALDVLSRLPFPSRWSTRVVPLGRAAGEREIGRAQRGWSWKRQGPKQVIGDAMKSTAQRAELAVDQALASAYVDRHALDMVQDAAEARRANERGDIRFCLTTQIVVVQDPDPERADTRAREVMRTLGEAGFPTRLETVNAVEALIGALPGHGAHNLRRLPLPSDAVAAVLPVTGQWPGSPTSPHPALAGAPALLRVQTEGATPHDLNLHVGDVGHTLVVGRTGAGKSTLLATFAAAWLRYAGAQVFYFDNGYAAWPLAAAAGACHYAIAAGRPDTLTFQPLAHVDEDGERVWAGEWLASIAAAQLARSLTPHETGRIDRALTLLAGSPRQHRTITECLMQLQSSALVSALRFLCVGGPYGDLVDATHDALEEGPFHVFELQHLFELEGAVGSAVLAYLLRRVEQRLDGRPTLIPIDEAAPVMTHPVFGPRIAQWLATLRKKNAAVVLATQHLDQLAAHPQCEAMLAQLATRIYLPDPEAMTARVAAPYRAIGLNDRELALLATAVPKRDYYLRSAPGSRRFSLGLGPVALAFLGTPPGMSADAVRRHLTALEAQHGTAWPAVWLRERGLDVWAERLAAMTPVGTAVSMPVVVSDADPVVPTPVPRLPSFPEARSAYALDASSPA